MKKVFSFISGLALVDSLSKIVMNVIPKDYFTTDDTITQTSNSESHNFETFKDEL